MPKLPRSFSSLMLGMALMKLSSPTRHARATEGNVA